MAKTNKMSKILVILLFVAIAATLTFAFVNVPTGAANAEETLVLPENTAKYEITNDPAEKSLWTYKRATNEWTSSKEKVSFGPSGTKVGSEEQPDPKYANVLKLTVTEPGTVAFEWKVGNTSNAIAVRHYTNVQDGDLENATSEFVINYGCKSTLEGTNYYLGSMWFQEPFSNLKELRERQYYKQTIENCAVNDVITIEFLSRQYSSMYYDLTVKGLQLPDNKFSVKAKVAEGETSFGTIKTERSGETSVDGNLTVQRGYDESVTFTAVPNEGYAAYWEDSTGKIVSTNNDYTVTGISEKTDNSEYTVRFVEWDGKIKFTSDKKDDQDYFTLSEDGSKYSVDFSVFATPEASSPKAKLNFSFVIPESGAFLTFDYFVPEMQGSSRPYQDITPNLYVNGSSVSCNFQKSSLEGEHKASTFTKYYKPEEAGYYTAYFQVSGSNITTEYEWDLFFQNIRICQYEELSFEEFTMDFDSETSEVWMAMSGHARQQLQPNVPIDVPRGISVTFDAFHPTKNKASSLDPSQQVALSISSIHGNMTDEEGNEYSNPSNMNSFSQYGQGIQFSATFYNSTKMHIQMFSTSVNKDFTIPEEGAKTNLLYTEDAVLSVEATKISDQQDEIISIADKQTVDFPFGKSNSMVVRIKTFGVFSIDDFVIKVDGKELSNELMELQGMIGFSLMDVANSSIEISYNVEHATQTNSAYTYKNIKLTFSAKTNVGGSIQDIVKTKESLTVTEEKGNGIVPWEFDPYRSTEDTYAYWGYLPEGTPNNTQKDVVLSFKINDNLPEQSGTLSFEFQLHSWATDTQCCSGQLYYQIDTPFKTDYSAFTHNGEGVGDILAGEYKGDATFLAGERNMNQGLETAQAVVMEQNGWYRASIPIEKGHTIYLGFFMGASISMGKATEEETWFSIRNLQLNTGTASVTLNKSDTSSGSVKATIGDVAHNESQFSVQIGSALNLHAEPGADEIFYGWSINGNLVSAATDITYFVERECTITAYMAQNGTYVARIDGVFYPDLKSALDKATPNQTVVVIKNNLDIDEDLTIEKGVTLLLPYNEAGNFTDNGTTENAENRIAWFSNNNDTYRYLTVTLKSNRTLTVNGTLRVGGIVNYMKGQGIQGHTSGAYAELILENNSKIQIASDGVMDVFGRVWGGSDAKSGMGSIDVAEGGKLYQPFLILDYAGGTNAFDSYMNGTTPFKRYAMVNIECPITVHYGGGLYGHASLWVETMKLLASLDQPFISYDMGPELGGDGKGNDTFITLAKNASVTITYDPEKVVGNATADNGTEGIGKTTMIFDGGATFSYMLFSAMGVSIPTSPVVFSIPYNYNVELNGDGANYETKTDFMIMPGATVKVGVGATLTLNANTWVLDGYVGGKQAGKQYPLASDLAPNYSKQGNLIVEGTLKIGQKTTTRKPDLEIGTGSSEPFVPQKIPATFLGIIQTTGSTGNIEIPAETVLNEKVWMGLANQDYFEYTTSARVWDAAHGDGIIATLQAGHTYTATGSGEFTLDSLKYTNTKDGDENQTLTLGQQLHGSWMEVHEGHNFDWTPNPDKDKLTGDSAVISRQCSVMGCNHEEKQYLFGDKTDMSAFYKGSEFSEEELKAIFLELFGLSADQYDVEGFAVEISHSGTILNAATDAYTLNVTLTKGVWLEGGAYSHQKEFHFKVNQYQITAKDVVGVSDGDKLNAKTYTGDQLKYDELVINFGGKALEKSYYDLTYGNNKTVAEDGTVTIKINSNVATNFKGEFTLKFDIEPAMITTVTVKDAESYVYNGSPVAPKLEVKSGDKLTLTEGDYDITYTTDHTKAGTVTFKVTGKDNFQGTIDSQTFEIKKAAATVTVTKAEGIYGDKPKEMQFEVKGYIGETDKGLIEKAVHIAHKATTDSGVGSYDVEVTFGDLDNYTVTVADNSDKNAYTVKAKSIAGATVTVGKSYVFTGSAIVPDKSDITVTMEGWEKEITFSFTVKDNVNVADKPVITITGTGNYEGTATKTEAFSITPAEVKIVVNDLYSALGDEIKKDYSYSFDENTTFFNDDKATFDAHISYECNPNKDQQSDDYPITMKYEEAQQLLPNYTITVTQGKYHVTASVYKDVKVKIKDADTDDLTITYDGKTHTLEVSGLSPEDANNATYEFTLKGETFNGAKDADTYNIKVKITVSGHAPLEKDIILKIEKKAIHVKADDISITYGDEDKELTWSVKAEDLAEADKDLGEETYRNLLDIKLNREQGNTYKDGGYKITGTGTAKNYSITVDEGIYTINKKDISTGKLTVTGEYTYNGNAHVPTWNELILGEIKNAQDSNVTINEGDVNITASENVNAGTNSATVTVEGQGNFTGKLTANFGIGKAAATVSITKAEGTYGDDPAAMKFEVNGFVNDTDKGLIEKAVHIAHKATKESAVGTYDVTVTFDTLTNYTVSVKDNSDKQAYEVKAKGVTVTLLKQEWATYNYKEQNAKSDSEYIALKAGSQLANDEELSDLAITLTASGMNAGSYDITPSWNNNNYNVTFEYGDKTLSKEEKATGAFVIGKATITVTVQAASSTYGDEPAQLKVETTGICEGDNVDVNSRIQLSCEVELSKTTAAGTYDITCTRKSDPENYTINIVGEAKYTVNKKDVTVTISDQNDVYNFQKAYKWDASAWTVDEKELANNENKSVLGVSLTRPALDGAGTYAILATYSSNNYNVTFEGAWAKEDSNKGKAGTYTVAKKHVVEDGETVMFTLLVDGEEYQGTEVFPYVGENFELTATVFVLEGEDYNELAYTIDPEKLTEVKIYTVTVTINDDNYEGSREFTVEVVTDDGFSQNLKNVLAELERIVGDVTKDTLASTQEHFEMIKKVEAELAKLTETDKELGAAKLAKYEELVETWHDAANISDEVIETAKTMADSPIKWLFALAEMSILLAAMYVIGKGGLM